MIYALDTNTIVNYLRNEPNVQQNFNSMVMQGYNLVVPRMVDYEILRGFRLVSAPKKEAAYKILTERCEIAEMDINSWKKAEEVYVSLYNKGFTVGEMDILIAAFCLKNDYTLVTSNIKDFENIDGLTLVDWNKR